jgi:biopolymer transport protein ExbD
MAQLLKAADPVPMAEMNTTPLIDVMLVLLVMFIITIPIQTHAVKLDLPQPCPSCPVPDPVHNTVSITAPGEILWNGQAVDRNRLRYMLAQTRRMRPAPELHLKPDPAARYELVDEILAITRKAEVTRMGFAGNEAYLNSF